MNEGKIETWGTLKQVQIVGLFIQPQKTAGKHTVLAEIEVIQKKLIYLGVFFPSKLSCVLRTIISVLEVPSGLD